MRAVISVALSVFVTLALFGFMAWLIADPDVVVDDEELPPIEIGFVEEEQDLTRKDRRIPKKPPPPKEPPPPQTQKVSQNEKPQPQQININMAKLDVGFDGGGIYIGNINTSDFSGAGDGEAIPLVTIEPQWPREALLKGTEGWVLLQFTINPDGSTKDVTVVDSNPRRLFDREATRAIYKWKFKPQIIDGKPVPQTGMKYKLEFKLDN